MTNIFNSEKFGEIVYEESFWTGRRKISINGKQLTKVGRTTFAYVENDVTYSVVVLGNFFTGVKLVVSNSTNPNEKEFIKVVEGFKWYEFIFAFIGFVFVIAWNLVPVEIYIYFPTIGGAIGGALSVAFGLGGMYFASKVKKWWARILIILAGSVIGILACWIIGINVLAMMI